MASRLTAWGFYLLHQVCFWAVIAYAQLTIGRSKPRYSGSLRLRLTEVTRIPLIDYAAVFALAGLIGGAVGLIRLLKPAASDRERRLA